MGSRSYVAHLHAYVSIKYLAAHLHSNSFPFHLSQLCCDSLSTEQKQKRIREEPSANQTEEVDAVEAFKACHTSSKHSLQGPAREALVTILILCHISSCCL
jgi:hypothetical protein